MPEFVLNTPSGMPGFDVTKLEGFNVYITEGANPEYLSNAAPIAAGAAYTVEASPGAGVASPDAVPTQAGQFTASSGVLTFAAPDAGKGVFVDYIWRTSATSAECTVVDILSNCLRGLLKAIWRMDVHEEDGSRLGLEMDIFKMKYSGDYNLETTRTDPTTETMQFDILLDGNRADRKLLSYKLFPLPDDTSCG